MILSEKLELLYEKNIKTGLSGYTREQAIREAGKMLVDTGYVKPEYVDAMLLREETVSTFMGYGLALPHGVEESKKEILASGISVEIFPDGIDWGGEYVNMVVGIAGVGEEHLNILSKVAEKVLDESTLKKILNGTPHEIYELLK